MTALADKPTTAPARAVVAPQAVLAPRVVAALLAVTGGIHVWVAPEHLAESPLAGWFFIALAGIELALAGAVVLRTTPWLLWLTGTVQAGSVVLFAWAHSTGLPFLVLAHDGSDHADHAVGGIGDGVPVLPAGTVEPPDVVGVSCVVAELVCVLVVLALLPPRARRIAANVLLALALIGAGSWWAHLAL